MTWKISIRGVVQGVGFRPFVRRAALDRSLKGFVANGPEGLVILLNATKEQVLDFQTYILNHAPATARIAHCSASTAPDAYFDDFSIRASERTGLPLLQLPPDVALCAECRREIFDPANRRYRYAFTTCTVCGPRYSILQGIPYDRHSTTMLAFDMCAACREEYENPADRRFYSQTNSCPDCGIRMRLFDCKAGQALSDCDQEAILQRVVNAWRSGAIVALKGIGGYLLTCDAADTRAIADLRIRKRRPSKPFALMYPNLEGIRKDAIVCATAAECLQSHAAPIVLLDAAENDSQSIDRQGIAPGLTKIGAMLPNAPLFELLLAEFGRPVVSTSGNASHSPLVYEDEAAIRELSGMADYILLHNRPIENPQDDSVMALRDCAGPEKKAAVVLRRARGLAPGFYPELRELPEEPVLTLGAEMKGTFNLALPGNLHISQYFGDLSSFDTQLRYRQALARALKIFGARPGKIVADLHPEYFSTAMGRSLASEWNVSFHQVQHHQAHFAAVLSENNLLKTEEPVLGIIWDGTGMGSDAQFWGGEFFIYAPAAASAMKRAVHFDYFPFLLGDKMSREPRISALAACFGLPEAEVLLEAKFNRQEWTLYQKLLRQPGPLMTSSAGRIFDAVACLLGLSDKVSFEGEAAMLLEAAARAYCRKNGWKNLSDYAPEICPERELRIDTRALFRQIIGDIKAEKNAGFIAASFHYSLVKLIQRVSRRLAIHNLAFSGGVFQNTLLLDMIDDQLRPEARLFFHRQLPPNDENISFGQWAMPERLRAYEVPDNMNKQLKQQQHVSRNSG